MSTLSEIYGFEKPFKVDQLVKKALPYIQKSMKVLDVGCGEGADSIFLAQNGLIVDAIDNNKIYICRLKAYREDHNYLNLSIIEGDVINHPFQKKYYDVINCLLVGCCMKRSEFDKLLVSIKEVLKPNGIIIMSLRNYLDPKLKDCSYIGEMIEPNTFIKKEDCCKIRYFIEKGRLLEVFEDFEILYSFEGLADDKYEEISKHGDSYVICRKRE